MAKQRSNIIRRKIDKVSPFDFIDELENAFGYGEKYDDSKPLFSVSQIEETKKYLDGKASKKK